MKKDTEEIRTNPERNDAQYKDCLEVNQDLLTMLSMVAETSKARRSLNVESHKEMEILMNLYMIAD
uniref:Uncharacterized protein n=1 Tax=Nelumbo nucifera TaxID=4432 RepID=A0A822Y598_NELNU|nr:TPA_asm: hypothetical protein HUJ06_029188 [Nelumbo nucifera]